MILYKDVPANFQEYYTTMLHSSAISDLLQSSSTNLIPQKLNLFSYFRGFRTCTVYSLLANNDRWICPSWQQVSRYFRSSTSMNSLLPFCSFYSDPSCHLSCPVLRVVVRSGKRDRWYKQWRSQARNPMPMLFQRTLNKMPMKVLPLKYS